MFFICGHIEKTEKNEQENKQRVKDKKIFLPLWLDSIEKVSTEKSE